MTRLQNVATHHSQEPANTDGARRAKSSLPKRRKANRPAVPRSLGQKSSAADHLKPHWFKKGKSGNPAGKPVGTVSALSKRKAELMEATGMSPLDFLTHVYRDTLHTHYLQHKSTDGKVAIYTPDLKNPECKKIEVTLEQRLSAASTAAPYYHQKQPVAIQGGDPNKPLMLFQANMLAQLPQKELELLLGIIERLGGLDALAGEPPATYNEDGDRVK